MKALMSSFGSGLHSLGRAQALFGVYARASDAARSGGATRAKRGGWVGERGGRKGGWMEDQRACRAEMGRMGCEDGRGDAGGEGSDAETAGEKRAGGEEVAGDEKVEGRRGSRARASVVPPVGLRGGSRARRD
jgi:hypothetical protein